MAEHFISEFFTVFADLGIKPEFYRMRDIYRSGKFNSAIDAILRKADVVRRIYKEVSGSERPDTWHPFQVICENCGRIGTTEVTAYDGQQVTYSCKPYLVKWAKGCGHEGKMSPFDGRGKLPWKLEWCAKWTTFPVTIEGAGRDHSTKGGSRDVAGACLREIFGQEPPLNCPYDFFLVGGAKMSSSKGIGVTSRDMADFLPPEVLRFLMIRTPPRQHVNFEPSEVHILKAFNEFDRAKHRYFHDANLKPDDKRIYELSQVTPEPDYWTADFQLVAALIQMPHLDAVKELEKRKGAPFTDLERKHLDLRIRAATYWLEHYATEDEKTRLQETLPERAKNLTTAQHGFLHILAGLLADATWTGEALQITVFNAARLTPIDQPSAFKAIYRVLLDRESGPKAGNLLSFLDRDFVIGRCREVPWSELEFLQATGLAPGAFERWLASEKEKIVSLTARYRSAAGRERRERHRVQHRHDRRKDPLPPRPDGRGKSGGISANFGPRAGSPVGLFHSVYNSGVAALVRAWRLAPPPREGYTTGVSVANLDGGFAYSGMPTRNSEALEAARMNPERSLRTGQGSALRGNIHQRRAGRRQTGGGHFGAFYALVADASESFSDVMGSCVTFYALKKAAEPADRTTRRVMDGRRRWPRR